MTTLHEEKWEGVIDSVTTDGGGTFSVSPAPAADYSPASSGFKNAVGRLRTLRLFAPSPSTGLGPELV